MIAIGKDELGIVLGDVIMNVEPEIYKRGIYTICIYFRSTGCPFRAVTGKPEGCANCAKKGN